MQVEAYGSKMPLNQLAVLSIPEPSMILVQPFDPSTLAVIEKAIRSSPDLSPLYQTETATVYRLR